MTEQHVAAAVACAVEAVASIVATSAPGPRWDAAWVRGKERHA